MYFRKVTIAILFICQLTLVPETSASNHLPIFQAAINSLNSILENCFDNSTEIKKTYSLAISDLTSVFYQQNEEIAELLVDNAHLKDEIEHLNRQLSNNEEKIQSRSKRQSRMSGSNKKAGFLNLNRKRKKPKQGFDFKPSSGRHLVSNKQNTDKKQVTDTKAIPELPYVIQRMHRNGYDNYGDRQNNSKSQERKGPPESQIRKKYRDEALDEDASHIEPLPYEYYESKRKSEDLKCPVLPPININVMQLSKDQIEEAAKKPPTDEINKTTIETTSEASKVLRETEKTESTTSEAPPTPAYSRKKPIETIVNENETVICLSFMGPQNKEEEKLLSKSKPLKRDLKLPEGIWNLIDVILEDEIPQDILKEEAKNVDLSKNNPLKGPNITSEMTGKEGELVFTTSFVIPPQQLLEPKKILRSENPGKDQSLTVYGNYILLNSQTPSGSCTPCDKTIKKPRMSLPKCRRLSEVSDLHRIIKMGCADSLEKIINQTDVNEIDDEGLTALQLAAKIGNTDMMNILIKAGANINAVDKNNNTALHYCAMGGSASACDLLLSKGCDIKIQNSDKATALHIAVWKGNYGIVQSILLYNNNSLNIFDDIGESVSDLAHKMNNTEIIELLEQYGIKSENPPAAQNTYGRYPSISNCIPEPIPKCTEPTYATNTVFESKAPEDTTVESTTEVTTTTTATTTTTTTTMNTMAPNITSKTPELKLANEILPNVGSDSPR